MGFSAEERQPVDVVVVVNSCHGGETKQHSRRGNGDAVFRENDIISDQHAGMGDGSVLSNKANEVSQLSRFGGNAPTDG